MAHDSNPSMRFAEFNYLMIWKLLDIHLVLVWLIFLFFGGRLIESWKEWSSSVIMSETIESWIPVFNTCLNGCFIVPIDYSFVEWMIELIGFWYKPVLLSIIDDLMIPL